MILWQLSFQWKRLVQAINLILSLTLSNGEALKKDLLILRMVTLLLLKLRHVFKTESLQFSMAYQMESGQELQN